MKSKILEKLIETNEYVSGQELCDTLSVSRTAVWKHINALKAEGYEIESLNKKGYRLVSCPNLITPEAIKPYLKTKWLARDIRFFEETDSTNTRIKAYGEAMEKEGILAIAEQQNLGKGRRGRNWVSPKGSGIWMSVLLRPEIAPANASMLTLVAAMAIAKSMAEIEGITYGIKWPNDIIVNKKKVCGILTEMNSEIDAINYVVVGIGINVNTKDFPDEIKDVATSLMIETKKEHQRAKIVAAVMNNFEVYYEKFLETGNLSELVDDYNDLLLNMNNEVRIIDAKGERILIARGIDETGALIAEAKDGIAEKIISGEVSVRGILGYV